MITIRQRAAVTGTLLLAVAMLPANAVAQETHLKDQLVGTWFDSSWEQVGPQYERLGVNPKGVNVFDREGHFYIMFARPENLKIASTNGQTRITEESEALETLISYSPGPDEAKTLAGGAVAFYGTYTVSEAAKTVVLHVDASSFPHQVGAEQTRVITSLTADELIYQSPMLSGGQSYVTMKRAK